VNILSEQVTETSVVFLLSQVVCIIPLVLRLQDLNNFVIAVLLLVYVKLVTNGAEISRFLFILQFSCLLFYFWASKYVKVC
jgi:hypothetical protein